MISKLFSSIITMLMLLKTEKVFFGIGSSCFFLEFYIFLKTKKTDSERSLKRAYLNAQFEPEQYWDCKAGRQIERPQNRIHICLVQLF